MPLTLTPITVPSLTTATVDGTGVFDVLMQANKAHLESEFAKNRIKGSEYATVYLGSLQTVMQTALTFLLEKDKNALQAELIQQQVLLAEVEVIKANATISQIEAQTLLVQQQTQNALAELAIINANATKVAAEVAQLTAETALTNQKTLNAGKEFDVLHAQKCKLEAEFDVLMLTREKVTQEGALLAWKVTTEKAQTTAVGVDVDSVVGRQKSLYQAQTEGFARDAEQKAAKVMVDSWNVRRTTDEGTVADGVNNLNDASVGRAVTRLLTGVNA